MTWYAVVQVPDADGVTWRSVPVDEAQARSMRDRGVYLTRKVRQAKTVASKMNKKEQDGTRG